MTNTCNIIDVLLTKQIDNVIKYEQIKNIILDYLWPIFDFKYLSPQNITPEGIIVITYNTLKFSEIRRNNFIKYGILIEDKKINIDCTNKEISIGINKLKDVILNMKEILC